MNRRGFLQTCLAAAAAPYVVTAAGVLMPVRKIITPRDYRFLVESNPGGYSWFRQQWSLDGEQWTDDQLELLQQNPMPRVMFNRIWVSREEVARLYPPCTVARS